MDQQQLLAELKRLRAYAYEATSVHLNAPETNQGFYVAQFKQVVHTLDRVIAELAVVNNADIHHAGLS